MIRAGSLRRRLTLLRATTSKNDQGEIEKTWEPIAVVWAERTAVSDAERAKADQVGASLTDRFVIRWSAAWADYDPEDQAQCEGRRYDVKAVKEIGFREGLEITALARSGRG